MMMLGQLSIEDFHLTVHLKHFTSTWELLLITYATQVMKRVILNIQLQAIDVVKEACLLLKSCSLLWYVYS